MHSRLERQIPKETFAEALLLYVVVDQVASRPMDHTVDGRTDQSLHAQVGQGGVGLQRLAVDKRPCSVSGLAPTACIRCGVTDDGHLRKTDRSPPLQSCARHGRIFIAIKRQPRRHRRKKNASALP